MVKSYEAHIRGVVLEVALLQPPQQDQELQDQEAAQVRVVQREQVLGVHNGGWVQAQVGAEPIAGVAQALVVQVQVDSDRVQGQRPVVQVLGSGFDFWVLYAALPNAENLDL